jgi:hypothetical protein
MAFGGFKLGQYRHWKKGAIYIAYDITTDEETQEEKVSYVRLSDGSRHTRFLNKFQAEVDPNRQEENGTGQRNVFKLMDTSVTIAILKNTKTPSVPAVIEDGQVIAAEVLGEEFTTLKEFVEANGIPKVLPIKLGDTVSVWTPLVDNLDNVETFTISGIINQGVYADVQSGHIFLPWSKLTAVNLSFK